jgi:hypothetical protein
MKKTPAGGTRPGSRTHAYRTGAGAWGLGRGPVSVEFEPANFPRLYQTAHSESTVDKWNNFFIGVVAGEARSAPDHGAKKPPSLQLNSRIGPQFAKSSSGLVYFSSSNLRQLRRICHDRC